MKGFYGFLLVGALVIASTQAASTGSDLLIGDLVRVQCLEYCPAIYDPVCGSNNGFCFRTFDNSCALGRENCQNPSNRYVQVPMLYCQYFNKDQEKYC